MSRLASPIRALVARRLHLRPSGLVRSGVNIFVRGMWRPPSFMKKLFGGKWDKGDRELCMSLGGLALVTGQGVSRRDLVAEKQYS